MLVAPSTHQVQSSHAQRGLLMAECGRSSVGSFFYGYWFSHERA